MARKSSDNPIKPVCEPKIKKEKPPSQKFIENALKSHSINNEVQIKKTVGYIFHWLAIVDDINVILAQLSDDKLFEKQLAREKLRQVKQECIDMATVQFQTLPEEMRVVLQYYLGQVVSAKDEPFLEKKDLITEEKNQIEKKVNEVLYQAITMKRWVDKFFADKTFLPVVKTSKGIYTAPIKLTIKDAHSLKIVVVHTKILSTVQSEEEGEQLPVISHGISDELTFRLYPWLKDKIPHSSYTLFFSCFLDGKIDASKSIIELSGMKKIEGLTLSDEDFGEGDEKVRAILSQSNEPSHEETSLAKKIKDLAANGKKVTEIYVTEKGNGAYAACQVFEGPDGKALLFVASKATPLLFEIPENSSLEEKKQFLLDELKKRGKKGGLLPLLYFIAKECIVQLSQSKNDNANLLDPGHPFWSGGMCVGEAEQGNHIIPLTGVPKIRWFKQTGLEASASIKLELEKLEEVGLTTVKHYSITAQQLPEKEKEWRDSKDIEGVVVYYKVDGKVHQIKYKAIPYIILRALREFLDGNRGEKVLKVFSTQETTLSSANRPEHLAQVINHFLERHPHLLLLLKNKEFAPIVEKKIEECKRDFPRFIRFLLDNGYSEKDLGFETGFGIGNHYHEFKESGAQEVKGRMIKGAESLDVRKTFRGLIIAISGPPGVGKDAVAEELAQKLKNQLQSHEYWQNSPLILSKDRAENELSRTDKKYAQLSDQNCKAKERIKFLRKEIEKGVNEKRIIITTTCNGSPTELAWITEAAKRHNLAVMPVYPKVSEDDITAFSAALIVSVLRRKEHPTLSASTEEAGGIKTLNSEFAQVIKERIKGDLYELTQSPTRDFYEKYFPTQFLSYFNSSSWGTFLKNTDPSEEKAKIWTALSELVRFLDEKIKEISTENLKVLLDAGEAEINKIFPRFSATELSNNLIEIIAELEKSIVYDEKRTLGPQANYYGAFLDAESEKKLREVAIKALEKKTLKDDSWLKNYAAAQAAEPDEKQQKKNKKKEAGRCSLHLTLVHANSLHELSEKVFSMLKSDLKVRLEVGEISYNKGVMYASNVRVLIQNESNFEEVTNSLVQSGKPHITLATRKGISPVYAVLAEEAREAGGARAQAIKTLNLDSLLTLTATVSTDIQNIKEKKKEAALSTSTNLGLFSTAKKENHTSEQAGRRTAACTTENHASVSLKPV